MSEYNIIVTGIFVFFARICDVSIGTVRTIVTVQGRTAIAFGLGLIEITIWILVVSTVILQVNEHPVLIPFYAFGYATGNFIGIIVERKLAFGTTILRVITRDAGKPIADHLRKEGQPVTVFAGEGMKGPVNELYIACRRRDIKWILPEVKKMDNQAFYVIEQARDVSKILKPIHTPIGGWRAVFKKK
jgi:uncharacterized protein YebE (UPF0316 family)